MHLLTNHEQEHASSGSCMARPRGGAVRQRASNVRLRIGPLRATEKTAEVEFIAQRTRPDGEEVEDAFDMNEVVMKLEDEEMDCASEQVLTEVPNEITAQDHSLDGNVKPTYTTSNVLIFR